MTDDSLLVEHLGVKAAIVEGSARNIKITEVEDLPLAEAILYQESEVRGQKSEARSQKPEVRSQKKLSKQ